MAVSVLLTVDLNRNVSEASRKVFNEKLAELKWNRLSLTTSWTARFVEGATIEAALSTAKGDVAQAAAAAGVSNYEAAAQAGHQSVEIWRKP